MQLKDLFKKTNYISLGPTESAGQEAEEAARKQTKKPARNQGIKKLEAGPMLTPFCKCPDCHQMLYIRDVEDSLSVCPECGYHFRLDAKMRIAITVDEGSFDEWDADVESVNVLDFPGYTEKLEMQRKKTGLKSAVMTGQCAIDGHRCAVAVMDSRFMMGSMGQAVGEKITRAIERATEQKMPVVIFTASGGARMQEGIFSLMQMAKTSSALACHNQAGQLCITVLTDPTTGGVTASFAMLGDIILAEPGALIGFAGRRVIEQTIKETIPDEFQTAEFLKKHGFVDTIVPRGEMRKTLGQLLAMHEGGDSHGE